jgi:hypothetical protein
MFSAVQRGSGRRQQHAQADMFLDHVVSAFVIMFLLPNVLLPGSLLLYHVPTSFSPIPFNSFGSSIRKLFG